MWDELMDEHPDLFEPIELLEALLRQYDALVLIHDEVDMDTPEDRALHNSVIDSYRSFGIVIRERMNEAKAQRAATPQDLPGYVKHVVNREVLKAIVRSLPHAMAASRGRPIDLTPIIKTTADSIVQALLKRPRP